MILRAGLFAHFDCEENNSLRSTCMYFLCVIVVFKSLLFDM